MDSFTLSRNWFNWCFENPSKIDKELLNNYKVKGVSNYDNGGFYMIKYNKNAYIGKSIDYLSRIKSHFQISSNKTRIDVELNNNGDFYESFLLAKYSDLGINFHNRKLETIIEQTFIQIAIHKELNMLNDRIYGHLQII